MSTHITDILPDWLAGALEGDELDRFEAHLDDCARCRDEVHLAERELGGVLVMLAPQTPSSGLKARIIDDLEPSARLTRFANPIADLIDTSVQRARELLAGIDDPAQWEFGPVPGIELFHIDGGPAVANAIVGFIRVASGSIFPEHKHLGEEKVFIVQGSFQDSHGAVYKPGDLVVEAPDSHHHFEACSGPKLIYLVVADQGIEMFGLTIGPDHPAM
jgi:putative transcriptional regulator